MITVDQYSYIRTAHRVYGKKIREIVRDTGHSRNTVRKALSEEHCGYSTRKDQPYPVLGQYLDIIDRWLKGDKDKPKNNVILQKGSTLDCVMNMVLRAVTEQ